MELTLPAPSIFKLRASPPCLLAVLCFTRRETAPPQMKFLYKVNSTRWQSLDAGLWLLRTISSRQIAPSQVWPGGWQTRYEFITAPDLELGPPYAGFTRVELFKDDRTGQPLSAIDLTNTQGVSNNGYVAISPYNKVDFNELGLPNIY